MTTGWVAPVNYADHQVYSFDGFTLRDWKTRSYDVFYGYFSFLDINWNNWKTTLKKSPAEGFHSFHSDVKRINRKRTNPVLNQQRMLKVRRQNLKW